MHDRLRARIPRGAAWRFCLPSPVHFPPTRPELSQKDSVPANNHFQPTFQSDAVTLPLCGNEGRCKSARIKDALRHGEIVSRLSVYNEKPFDSARYGPNDEGPFKGILDSSRFSLPVNSGETSALALRVLRATAQYSICGWGEYTAPSTDYVPVTNSIIKALERTLEGCSRIEEGSRGVLR